MKKVGEFGSSLAGDIVRVTAGTNVTAGWYWIRTVDSADQITLDRNWVTGDTTNGSAVLYPRLHDAECGRCLYWISLWYAYR